MFKIQLLVVRLVVPDLERFRHDWLAAAQVSVGAGMGAAVGLRPPRGPPAPQAAAKPCSVPRLSRRLSCAARALCAQDNYIDESILYTVRKR